MNQPGDDLMVTNGGILLPANNRDQFLGDVSQEVADKGFLVTST